MKIFVNDGYYDVVHTYTLPINEESFYEEYTYNFHFSIRYIVEEINLGFLQVDDLTVYIITVYVDKDNNMVVIKNPTISNKPQKSDYQPKPIESDGTIDVNTSDEINSFLDTFFKLYPTATAKELEYYVSGNILPVINKNYVFEEIVNPIYIKEDKQVKAVITVKYLDQETKITQFSQYELVLEKQDNWKIVEVK